MGFTFRKTWFLLPAVATTKSLKWTLASCTAHEPTPPAPVQACMSIPQLGLVRPSYSAAAHLRGSGPAALAEACPSPGPAQQKTPCSCHTCLSAHRQAATAVQDK